MRYSFLFLLLLASPRKGCGKGGCVGECLKCARSSCSYSIDLALVRPSGVGVGGAGVGACRGLAALKCTHRRARKAGAPGPGRRRPLCPRANFLSPMSRALLRVRARDAQCACASLASLAWGVAHRFCLGSEEEEETREKERRNVGGRLFVKRKACTCTETDTPWHARLAHPPFSFLQRNTTASPTSKETRTSQPDKKDAHSHTYGARQRVTKEERKHSARVVVALGKHTTTSSAPKNIIPHS